jgi:peptidase C39-like protein
LCTLLLIASFFPYRFFINQNNGTYKNAVDEDGITRQTTNSSCAAAAGATLLSYYGIKITESEMAGLAFTKLGEGTEPLGIFRAFKILTAGDDHFRVRIRKISFEDLIKENKPAVIIVGLPGKLKTKMQKDLSNICHWPPGSVHAVTFLGNYDKDDSKIKIGEPDFGLEHWPKSHLKILFRESAIFLK